LLALRTRTRICDRSQLSPVALAREFFCAASDSSSDPLADAALVEASASFRAIHPRHRAHALEELVTRVCVCALCRHVFTS
jgi:hypothetical protein